MNSEKKFGMVAAVTAMILASGCASRGNVEAPDLRTYDESSTDLYAQLIEKDGEYSFRNFGGNPDPVSRNVNLSDFSYQGKAGSSEVCSRGLLGLTSGDCDEAFEFSRTYTPPAGAVINLIFTPIIAPFALFEGEGSGRFFPVLARVEFDYEEFYDAVRSAQNSDNFSERYPQLVERYTDLKRQYNDLTNYHREQEAKLLSGFRKRVTLPINTVNLSSEVKPHSARRLSDSAIEVEPELSVTQSDIRQNPFSFDGSSQTLGDFETQLDKAEAFIVDAKRRIDNAALNVKFSLDSNYRKELNDYLADVEVPGAIQWTEDSESLTLPTKVTFKTASQIRQEITAKREVERETKIAKQERKHLAEIAERDERNRKLTEFRSSIGRRYCANGEIQYYSPRCAYAACNNIARNEPAQLVAFLEDFSADAERIQLRTEGWATDTGQTRHQVNSEIAFVADGGWRRTTSPGVLSWSDSDDWYQCSR